MMTPFQQNLITAYSDIHHPINGFVESDNVEFDGCQKPKEFFQAWNIIDENLPSSETVSFLEIGAAKGLWAIAFIELCKLRQKKPIYTTVTWMIDNPSLNFALHKVVVYYTSKCDFLLIDANSQVEETRNRVTEKLAKYDFVFIDADHNCEAVTRDIKLYGPLATKLLMFHDIRPKNDLGVFQALKNENIKLDYEFVCHENIMGIGIKKI